ncbi:ATP-binding protein [Parvibaculaceae bacterium PLY_AMNH_Bact1]|nr:ATP-binding protein [Parvibaculaceae bacterium PLY_AMNH_Bact1]
MDLASSFSAVASSLTDGFVTIDSKGIIAAVNPAVEDIFGYSSQELHGKNISILMPPDDADAHQSYIDTSTVGEKGRVLATNRTLRGRRKDGTIVPVTVTVFALKANTKEKFYVGLITDQSDAVALSEERRRAELLYSNIDLLDGVGLWRIDVNSRALEWTDQLFEIHGLSREFFGLTIDSAIACYHPEDQKSVAANFAAAIETGRSFYFTGRIIRPNQTVRHIRTTGKAAHGPDGTPIAVFGTTLDITEQQEREKRLSRYSQQQGVLKEILYKYSHGQTPAKFFAQAFNSISNYPWSYAITAQALLLKNAGTKEFEAAANIGFDTEEIEDLQICCTAPERSNHLDSFILVPLLHNTKTLGYLAFRRSLQTNAGNACTAQEENFLSAIADILAICLIDINKQETIADQNSELKAEIVKVQKLSKQFEKQAQSLQILSDELEVAKEKAETASETKSAFLANMSHEMRTPLNGVLGMLSVLEMSSLDDEQVECIDLAKQAAYAALELMNDLLDLSQLAAGKLSITPEEFRLEDLITRLETMLGPKAKGKDLDLLIENDLGQATIDGDALRLQQILINLGDNAIKFTEQGSVKIEFSQTPEQGDLCITVTDTGAGMTPDQLDRIFDRFEQVDPSSTRKQEGVGLGLAICQNLAELMQGEIMVTSEKGVGTHFTVTLPLPVSQSTGAEQKNRAAPKPTVREGLKILAAEDNIVNQELLRRLSKILEIDLTIVNNGAEAVDAVEAQDFDLVLMDVHMPIMDGVSASKTIRAAGSSIPIVAVTADVMDKDRKRFENAGMQGYVSKPYEIGALLCEIERMLDLTNHQQSDLEEVTQQRTELFDHAANAT